MHIITRVVLIVYTCLLYSVIHAQIEKRGAQPVSEQNTSQYRSTSEQRISYDDVYGLELELPFASNIEVNAVAADEMIIKLEKQGTGINEGAAQTYLDAVKLEISRDDDILLLKPQLPDAPDSNATLTRMDCFINTPPDISLKIKTESGDIRVHGIRGNMVLTTAAGHIHLDEAMGEYQVSAQEGQIYGRILLTGGTSAFETQSGSINLVVMDEIAAEMILTASEGEITLRLPENYPAEIEMQVENKDQHAITIDMPFEIETAFVGDVVRGWINDGGPLIQMTAGQRIAVLSSKSSSTESEADDSEAEANDSYAQDGLTPPPTVDVPRASVPPVIDGDLFEKAWAKSVPLSSFYMADATAQPKEPTEGFLLWDDQYLYIGARIYDSQMKRIQITQTKPDSAVWSDDTLEILVDPNTKTPTYHHLVINPIGTVFDQHIEADYSWDSDVEAAYEGIAKPAWDSRAQVKTQIAPTFWSVEVALPRDALEPPSSENWRFNLHRKMQRHFTESSSKPGGEYSYWSPTYDIDRPWWPHWPDRLGVIHLAETENSEAAQGFLMEQLQLVTIEVEGNTDIPTSEILQRFPFQPGDVISISELSWLNRELEDLGWFGDVRLETTDVIEEGDEPFPVPIFKVNLRMHVTEAPTGIVQKLDLRRNRYFTSGFLRKGFGLNPGRTSIKTLDTKRQLIENLYKHHGYDLARVEYLFPSPRLLINIDEGHLDDIRFSGNRRVRRTELIDALGFKQGDAYNKQIGTLRLNQMRAKLSAKNLYFKAIKTWEVKREGDQNVLAIEVEERSLIDLNLLPVIDFNRVHGLILGGSGKISTIQANTRIFGEVRGGLSSKIWNYQLGGEKAWFDRHALNIGGNVYKLTDTNNYTGLSAFLSAALFGQALDYYQREGYQAWVKQQLTPSTNVMLEFTDEDHENLFKSTDWSLFDTDKPKRSNLRIDEGHLRTVTVAYQFDSQEEPSHQIRNFWAYPSPNHRIRRGWRGNFSVEYVGKRLKSDFDFTLSRFKIVRYNQLSGRHYLDFRLEGGFSDAPLPRQRLLYLGGIGTLRGYDFKELVGDNMLFFNIEYRLHFGKIGHFDGSETALGAVIAFLDTGYAWFDNESLEFDRFNTSVGIGLSLFAVPSFAFRLEIARALRKGRNVTPILRLTRMF